MRVFLFLGVFLVNQGKKGEAKCSKRSPRLGHLFRFHFRKLIEYVLSRCGPLCKCLTSIARFEDHE